MNTHQSAAAVLASVACATLCHAQANDSCANAEPISGYATFNTSTVGATTDGGVNASCNFFNSNQIWADVWMCWQATGGTASLTTFELCGTTFDTKLAVYPGSQSGCVCPDESSIIGCNDDACSLQSRVTIATSPNQFYMLRIGSYSANGVNPPTGNVTLTVKSGALAEIVNPANNHVYVAFATTSWSAAEATAQQLGSHLVSINDAAEQDWIHQNFGNLLGQDRRIWIGFNDVAVEGDFQWSDGAPVTFTNWNGGEPNNSGGTEDWTELLGSSGKWNDIGDSGGSFAHIGLVELGAPTLPCPADFTHDGLVDGADLGTILGEWGIFGSPADLTGDGLVDGADLGILLGEWGPCR